MVRRALFMAVLCAAAAGALYLAVMHLSFVRTADLRTLDGFMGLWPLPGAGLSEDLIQLFNPAPFVALVLLIVAAGVLMDRTRAGLLAAGMMLLASATTQILKPLLAFHR